MRQKHVTIDAAMTILLPCLMAYSLIGEMFHEIAGIAMLALFIAHHILNHAWFRGLFRGQYSPYRAFTAAVDLLLCVVMLCLPLSGIMMSKHLFKFLPTAGFSATARTVHLLCSYWGFALMSLHLGLHMDAMLKKKPKWLGVTAGVVSLYGAYAFVKRDLPLYMTLRSRFVFFDYAEPRVWFFVDYLAIMALFAALGYGIGKALKGKRK
ncbi:MAG: DUF4405 domain-containing protein [Ruminococcaceae bacterium]|nr:DUF4405 domain-containing protein [Oscillospiraceae bacterium]